MALNDITLGGVLLSPFGRKFSETIIEIAKEDRTLSGRKVKDIIATKKEFRLEYEIIDDAVLVQLRTLYDAQTTQTLRITYRTGETLQYTVIMKPFEYKRENIEPDALWSGVTIILEEV